MDTLTKEGFDPEIVRFMHEKFPEKFTNTSKGIVWVNSLNLYQWQHIMNLYGTKPEKSLYDATLSDKKKNLIFDEEVPYDEERSMALSPDASYSPIIPISPVSFLNQFLYQFHVIFYSPYRNIEL